MHEAALRAAVGQHERLLLHEVVRDLVEHFAGREEHVLERLLHAAHDHVAIRDGVVRSGVVVCPVLAPERLVGAEPRFFAAILRQAAQLRAGIEVMIRRLPTIAAAAAMDHHPDRAVVAIDLHLDEVIAAAHRAQLRQRLVARAAYAIGIERCLVDRDELALADLGVYAERAGAVAEDFLDVALAEARHVPRPMAADTGRDARFDGADPAPAFVLVRDVGGRELGHPQVEHAAGNVVTAAGLNDDVVGNGDAADGNAVTQVRVGHQIEADDAGIGRGACGLLPELLVGLGEQRRGQECVDVDAHFADARQHVVAIGQPFDSLAEGHLDSRLGGGQATGKAS